MKFRRLPKAIELWIDNEVEQYVRAQRVLMRDRLRAIFVAARGGDPLPRNPGRPRSKAAIEMEKRKR